MPRLLLTDEFWPKLKLMMLEAGIYDKPGLRLTSSEIIRDLQFAEAFVRAKFHTGILACFNQV